MFLNITPGVLHVPPPSPSVNQQGNPTTSQPTFILTFEENPLTEFVELPEEALEGGLWFSNVLCGVIRGALEMVSPYRRSPSRVLLICFEIGSDASTGRIYLGHSTRGREHRNSSEASEVLRGRSASRRRLTCI